jgi:hypothetical protein
MAIAKNAAAILLGRNSRVTRKNVNAVWPLVKRLIRITTANQEWMFEIIRLHEKQARSLPGGLYSAENRPSRRQL